MTYRVPEALFSGRLGNFLLIIFAFTGWTTSIGALSAAECAPIETQLNVTHAETINIREGNLSDSSASLTGAIAYWSSACGNEGAGFPTLEANGSGAGINVTVNFQPGTSTNSSGSCGSNSISRASDNSVTGATVVLFETEVSGSVCNQTDSLAHEIGHILGLADAGSMSCAGTIMGAPFSGSARTVQGEHCDAVDGRWRTPGERPGPGGPDPTPDGPCSI